MKNTLVITIIALLLTSCGASKATLTGTIKESSKKAPIENATVRVGDIEAKTDRNGEFKLEGLPAGKTSIFVLAEGFKPYEFGGFDLKEGDNKIDEIFIEKDLKVVKDPDSNKIIEPPPLPGTPVKQKPVFKKLESFTNCMVTIVMGDAKSGGGNAQVYKYSGNVIKIENKIPSGIKDPNFPSPDIYLVDGRMITNAGKDKWISTPVPKDPNNPQSGPDMLARFSYDLIFRLLNEKTVTINSYGKVKNELGDATRYYIVSEDSQGNLFDGEIFTPSEGQFKDYLLKFSGRLLINGTGDRTELTIMEIGKMPELVVPSNIQVVEPPPMVPVKPDKIPIPKNP